MKAPTTARSPGFSGKGEGKSSLSLFPSQLGWMGVIWQDITILRITFGHKTPQAALKWLDCEGVEVAQPSKEVKRWKRRLEAFAKGKTDDFLDIEIDESHLTDFQRRVVQRCREIPGGETLTYAQLAEQVGSPGAARAVGNVMRANRFPLIVPCHRVVGSGGSLGGYSAPEGLDMKRRLLELEGVAC